MSKFKKYKNKYTNDNIIHSFENILAMPMTETLARSAELNSQYNQIGFPRNSELNASPNAVYVHAYTRSDGTQVRAHWRSSNGDGANQSYGGQTDSKPVPQYNPPSLDGYIDENGNIIQRNPDGSEIVIGQQGQLPDVPIKQNPDGTYDFDYEYEDVENPYPNDDSVFKKAPDYPSEEESTNPSDGFTKKIKDLLGKILTNSASSSFVPEPVVFEGVDNLNFQQVPIYSNNGVYSQVGTGNRISANQNNAVSGMTPYLYKQTGSFSRPDFQSAAGNTLSGDIGQSRQRAVQTNPSFGNPQRVISNSSLPFGITFEDGVAQPVNLNLPSGYHSQSDWDMLSNGSSPEQIPTITPYKPTGIHPVDFAKSVDSGFSHGVMSLPMGIDKLVRNHIRAQMGLPPQSDETITEEYERAIGTPQGRGVGYNIGFFLGNIIPFVLANSVAVVMFPEISVLLINAMVLAGVISDSANEVGTSDKETLAKDIISRLAMNMALGFVGQKVSAFKETEIVFNKIYGLVNRIENQLTDLWRDILRYLYLMSRSKVPVFVTAVNGQRVFNYGGFNYFVQLDKELKSYQTYKTVNSGSRGKSSQKKYLVDRKEDYLFDKNDERFCYEIQVLIIKETNKSRNSIKSIRDMKRIKNAFGEKEFEGFVDFTFEDAQKALNDGVIKIYSRIPIVEGGFVTTSEMIGTPKNGKGDFLIVPIKDVAWKNSLHGQYAPIIHRFDNLRTPLTYKGKYVNNGKVYYELDLPGKEYSSARREITTYAMQNGIKNCELKIPCGNYIYTVLLDEYSQPTFIGKEFNP